MSQEPTREEWAMWAAAIEEKPKPRSNYEWMASMLGMDWRGAAQASEAQMAQLQLRGIGGCCQCGCHHHSIFGGIFG